jgi:Esterase/lipase
MKRTSILIAFVLYAITLKAQSNNKAMESILEKVNADRDYFKSLGKSYAANNSVAVNAETIAGVNCYYFTPPKFDSNKIIIYLHGGSFALGSLEPHRPLVTHLSADLEAKVLFIDYALAPEKPFPNGLNDILKVYAEITSKYPGKEISLIGDSAGGGLAVSFINSAIKDKLPLPERIVLISPWLYLSCNTDSHKTRKKLEQILTTESLLAYSNYYMGNKWQAADPSRLTFTTFPPLLILVGSNEILFDDSRLFYDKIKKVQPNSTLKEYAGKSHVWLLTDISSEESKDALNVVKKFLQDKDN